MTPARGGSSDDPSLRVCSVCAVAATGYRPGPDGRPGRACPNCGSLDRHRFLRLLVGAVRVGGTAGLLVDVAPERLLSTHLRRLGPYVALDLDPAADRRRVDLVASLTALPLAAGSVEVLLCYHVLEHIPDDTAAMREISRVLAPGAVALVQVPWRAGRDTDEDPTASRAERIARFGQHDHVRYYGRDLPDRMAAAGLRSILLTPADVLGPHTLTVLGLVPDEPVWLVGRAGDDAVDLLRAALPERVSDELGALLDRVARAADRSRRAVEVDRDAAAGQARHWEDAYRRLRGAAPVRAMLAVRRRLGRPGPANRP